MISTATVAGASPPRSVTKILVSLGLTYNTVSHLDTTAYREITLGMVTTSSPVTLDRLQDASPDFTSVGKRSRSIFDLTTMEIYRGCTSTSTRELSKCLGRSTCSSMNLDLISSTHRKDNPASLRCRISSLNCDKHTIKPASDDCLRVFFFLSRQLHCCAVFRLVIAFLWLVRVLSLFFFLLLFGDFSVDLKQPHCHCSSPSLQHSPPVVLLECSQ